MNPQQKEVYDHVISNKEFRIFLDGVAGTGKSFLIKKISSSLRELGKKCLVLSHTAIAASNIDGNTIYKVFGFGLDRNRATICCGSTVYSLEKKGEEYVIKKTYDEKGVIDTERILDENCKNNCIIIDEISMVSLELLDDMNSCLCAVFKNNKIFGGVNYIMSGHLSQLRPVSETAIFLLPKDMKHFFKDETKRFELTLNQRQDDEKFFKLCNSVMISCLSSEQKKTLRSRMTINFPDVDFSKKLHIFPTKTLCEKHNTEHLKKLNSEKYFFIKSRDEGDNIFLNTKEKESFNGLPRTLVVSNNCKVMITTNGNDLINGQTFFIKNIKVSSEITEEMFFQGLSKSEIVELSILKSTLNNIVYCYCDKTEIKLENDLVLPTNYRQIFSNNINVFTRTMFPIQLSWAVTTHKIQGITLDEAVLDMSNKNFDPVQIYINITRLKSLDGLYISDLDLPFKSSPHKSGIASFIKKMK